MVILKRTLILISMLGLSACRNPLSGDSSSNFSLLGGSSGPTFTCSAGYYSTDGVNCIEAGVGYYQDGTASARLPCTNAPGNSSYSSSTATSSDCPWICDNDYLSNGSSCVSTPGATGLFCATGEVAVGIWGQAGWVLDHLGVRCQTLTNGVLTGSAYTGTGLGGIGGTSFGTAGEYDCPSNSVLAEVDGYVANFSSVDRTGAFRFRCKDLTTGVLSAWIPQNWTGGGSLSATCNSGLVTDITKYFGSCDNVSSFDYACGSGVNSSGSYINGIVVVNVGTAGPIEGISCR